MVSRRPELGLGLFLKGLRTRVRDFSASFIPQPLWKLSEEQSVVEDRGQVLHLPSMSPTPTMLSKLLIFDRTLI